MEETRRVIITGAPGTGKTSLLQKLKDLGYPCHSEISRATIKEQLSLNSNLLPWVDLTGFSHLVFERQKQQYEDAVKAKVNFYDRGMPDVLAYLRKDQIYEEQLEQMAKTYLYHNTIFLTPPWPEIYGQDAERREDLQTMEAIHHALLDVYNDLGYEVIEVPRISIEARLHYILKILGLKK